MMALPAEVADAVTAAAGLGCSSGDRAALKVTAVDSTEIGVRSEIGTTAVAATIAAVTPAVINDRTDSVIATPHSLLAIRDHSLPVPRARLVDPQLPRTAAGR